MTTYIINNVSNGGNTIFFEVKLWFVSCFVHNNVKRLKITMETRNPFDDGNDFSIHNRELVVNMLLCILKLRTKKLKFSRYAHRKRKSVEKIEMFFLDVVILHFVWKWTFSYCGVLSTIIIVIFALHTLST